MALDDDVRRAVQRQVRQNLRLGKSVQDRRCASDVPMLMQVEFYFSDSNLPRDKFLREKIQEDPEVLVLPRWAFVSRCRPRTDHLFFGRGMFPSLSCAPSNACAAS